MGDIAGWVAPIATTIAAMMTAANLGPRITGWGFIVFTVGSIAWVTVATTTDQPNLLWANGFLTIVNLIGIWRWLGREARFGDGARRATAASGKGRAADLFPLTEFVGRPLIGTAGGAVIGRTIGAMIECDGGRVSYIVAGEGGVAGVGERLHAIRWTDLVMRDGGFAVPLDAGGLARLPLIDATAWPAGPPAGLHETGAARSSPVIVPG